MVNLLNVKNNYYSALVDNAKSANDAISKAQNWLLILWLAELSFIWTNLKYLCLFKLPLTLLLFWFIFFIIWSVAQYKHLLNKSRHYHSLINNVLEYIKNNSENIDKLPESLSDKDFTIRSSNVANFFFLFSFLFILISTLLLLLLLLFIM